MAQPKRSSPSLFAHGALAVSALLLCGSVLAEPQVSLKTSMGEIVVDLNQDAAPKTVANFLKYVKSGFYKGTVFHRVIDGFMIQGGGLTEKLLPKRANKPIPNESKNGLSNQPYTISMAREDNPDSATSQFFINVGDNSGLDFPGPKGDGGYTVFGKVVKGQDVVDKIAKTVVDDIHGLQNVPVTPVVIKSASIVK